MTQLPVCHLPIVFPAAGRTMKLTTKSIRSLELAASETERIIFDDEVPGFGIRVRAGGSRSYVVQYKIGTKQRRMSLGKITLQGVEQARESAKDVLAKVRLGQDPAGEKHHLRSTAAETFGAMAEKYLAFQKPQMRDRSYKDIDRHLMVHAKPLHELLLSKIQRRDIASVINTVRSKGAAVTANRVRATLSALYSWAIGEGLADVNPVSGTTRTEERSRDRVLSFEELRTIWSNLEEDHFGAIMKLLMLTGQRASEIAGLARSELTEYGFTLPPERTKNGREHSVPLSDPARAIILAQPERQNADGKPRDLIFGSGPGPFSGWTKSREALDSRIAKKLGKTLPHWTPHDLRRSFATHASGIGIQPHVIEAVLNHVSGFKAGVAGIYNRHSYDAEKKTALALWADHLLTRVERLETNVAPLKRA
jgi:integrase